MPKAIVGDASEVREFITQNDGPGAALEFQVQKVLEEVLPHSFLANVPVFRPDAGVLPIGMATELDFVLHAQTRTEDRIVIVECKSCPIEIEAPSSGGSGASSEWICCYGSDRKPIKSQLRHQRRALLLNIEPLQLSRSLQVTAIVVCSHGSAPTKPMMFEDPPDFRVLLLRPREFRALLESGLGGSDLKFLRVQQSEILRRLRLGQPILEIGHPEISHAVEYAARARKFIDGELFRHLRPAVGLWAINGSAGMGKSMLLAYALLALVTDIKIGRLRGEVVQPQSFSDEWAKAGVPLINRRRIWAVAQTDMQVEALRRSYERYVGYLAEIDQYNQHIRVIPQFRVLRDIRSLDDCNILLVDEAHDLTVEDQSLLSDWLNARRAEIDPERKRYLIVACDRHQKLRLVGPDARIVEGLSFAGRTVKLDRNYRNPFAVYAGSIALLFRWFAESGPKVIPSETDTRAGFSFDVLAMPTNPGAEVHLAERNDAHPANNWSHVLSEFPTAQEAHQQLRNARLGISDVLWLRFGPEDPSFNYQNLTFDFTYHPVRADDAGSTIDRYVKGQEYPIVVLEGLPDGFDDVESQPDSSILWQARRLFYLAASRATVFLFFVLPQDMARTTRREFDALLHQLGHPPASPIVDGKPSRQGPSGKFWEIRFHRTSESLSLRNYLDLTEAKTEADESHEIPKDADAPATRIDPAVALHSRSPAQVANKPLGRGTEITALRPGAMRTSELKPSTHSGSPPLADKKPSIQQPKTVPLSGRPVIADARSAIPGSPRPISQVIAKSDVAKLHPGTSTKMPPQNRVPVTTTARPSESKKKEPPEPTVQEVAAHLGVGVHVIVRDAQRLGLNWLTKPSDKVAWPHVNRLCAAAGKPLPT